MNTVKYKGVGNYSIVIGDFWMIKLKNNPFSPSLRSLFRTDIAIVIQNSKI